jgi:predicted nucleotidyltransferase
MKAVSGMNPTRMGALEQVRAIVVGPVEGHGVQVYLVSSCARGDAVRTSDIDVAMNAGERLPPLLSIEIKDQLEESTVPYFMDVVDLASVDVKYRRELLDGAVEWTSAKG